MLSEIEMLLTAKEGENIEFKEGKNNFHFEKLVQYACAISNYGGGKIVFGISDKRPRKIVGSQVFPQPERTIRGLMDRLHIKIDFDVYEPKEGRVLVFKIAGRPIGLPIQSDGIVWSRDGDSLVPMDQVKIREIYAESGHDFSGDICEEATLDDLDSIAISNFRKQWFEKTKNNHIKNCTDEQLLIDCEAIYPNNKITYAALILFGNHSSLGRLLSQSELIFEYRSKDVSGPANQRKEFRQGFFCYYDELWNLLNLRNDVQHYQDGLFVFDIPTFNERVVREAILNAVSHRNYQLSGSIFVRQYNDRLVIDSPGGFPAEVNVENILDRQSPRNRRVAEILSKCGLVERSGQGVNLMYEISIKEAKALPDYTGTDSNLVRVTLNGLVLDNNLLVYLNNIEEETLSSFSTEDLLIINGLCRNDKIRKEYKNRVPRLLELGVIEKIGRDKYSLSKRYYKISGKAGVHTRIVGLDRDTNKQLLLKHIRENDGASMKEFQQVLPSLSRSQIQVLIRELKQDNKIKLLGHTRGAKWYINE